MLEDSYELIQIKKCPSETEILRQFDYKPESQFSNLPLSIFNLIHFADKIGEDDLHLFEEV